MANGSAELHPFRRPEVLEQLEAFVREYLRLSGGTGRISIEVDYNAWKPVCWRPVAEGGRRDLTRAG